MLDANQVWSIGQAIDAMRPLAEVNPWWIEEPTSPDDVLGHKRIREAIKPIRVATGEHVQNRVIFKQLMQAGAIDFCQVDSCRLGGVNEVLAVLILAAKFGIPVCPHAGGVGLCEYVQHLAIFDFIAVSLSHLSFGSDVQLGLASAIPDHKVKISAVANRSMMRCSSRAIPCAIPNRDPLGSAPGSIRNYT